MEKSTSIYKGVLLSLTLPALVALPQQSFAQEEQALEEIVTIGTRRADRSPADTPVPIDVISGAEFTRSGSPDVQDLLRTSVASFNVNVQPINDASTISRPANLRGLSPDNTLVLVNGKRRHRGAVITFLGGGVSDGAQGVDIAAIPSLALKRVEVLRDGASSQYGSDAIAGVLNFILRDDAEGGFLQASTGSTFEGDGDSYQIAGNIGLPLGSDGFLNLTAEYGETDGTIRSVVRSDVAALIAAGNADAGDFRTVNAFTDEVPQYWGQPDVTDDLKLFVNGGVDLSDNTGLYFFGGHSSRTVEGGFFYRNPTNRGGVYAGPSVDATGALDPSGGPSVLVGDLDGIGVGGACPAGIPLTGPNNLIPDPTILAQVAGDANCFSFVETIPGGFVPRFGGDMTDLSLAAGLRGEWSNGLNYDFSIAHGSSEAEFFIRNTVNASLGPNSPRDFIPGGQEQTETVIDADFSLGVDVGLASDLNIAFGVQYREEEFDLRAGDPASFALGPLVDQGFGSGSNGFGGFANSSSNSQDSIGAYVDLEADVTEAVTLQGAVRYEDYDKFGDTTDFKVAGLFRVTDTFSIRASYSTGFHAPTAGQANITNVTTTLQNGVLVDQGTLPLNTVPGQLAADFIESQGNGRPSLGPEEADSITLGVAFDIGESSWTIDYYDIDIDGRLALSADVSFLDALNFAGGPGSNFATVTEGLTALDAAGAINRQDFVGFDQLQAFRFFSNSFDTNTNGIDIVGKVLIELAGGNSELTLALNFNETEVTDVGTLNPIGAGRVQALEELLPETKGTIAWSHTQDRFRSLVRVAYYGDWVDTGFGCCQPKGSEVLVDVEVAYSFLDNLEVIAGVNNLFDTFPDEQLDPPNLFGMVYPENSPFGFNGAQWYLRGRLTF